MTLNDSYNDFSTAITINQEEATEAKSMWKDIQTAFRIHVTWWSRESRLTKHPTVCLLTVSLGIESPDSFARCHGILSKGVLCSNELWLFRRRTHFVRSFSLWRWCWSRSACSWFVQGIGLSRLFQERYSIEVVSPKGLFFHPGYRGWQKDLRKKWKEIFYE